MGTMVTSRLRSGPAPWRLHYDTHHFPRSVTARYVSTMHWMRKRGARVRITTGKYTGQTGTVDSNVFQRTVDDPDELANGYHVMLDTDELVTVRWDQAEAIPRSAW